MLPRTPGAGLRGTAGKREAKRHNKPTLRLGMPALAIFAEHQAIGDLGTSVASAEFAKTPFQ